MANFLDMLLGNLTKPGLTVNGQTEYFPDEEARNTAGMRVIEANRPQLGMGHVLPFLRSPMVQEDGGEVLPPDIGFSGGPEFSSPSINSRESTPSFQQATDPLTSTGSPASGHSGLTKKGILVNTLLGGLFGGMRSAGTRTLGQGFENAEQAPIRLAGERLNLQHGQLENRALSEALPFLGQQRQAGLDRERAQTDYYRAGVTRRGIERTPRGLYSISPDGSRAELIPGTEIDQKPTLEESVAGRREIIKGMRGDPSYSLRPDEENEYVLTGKISGRRNQAASAYSDFASGYSDTPKGRQQAARDWANLHTHDYGGQHQHERENDQADAEEIAAGILNHAGGNPDAALQAFDYALPQITDKRQKALAPRIREAIRQRKTVNQPKRPDAMERALESLK